MSELTSRRDGRLKLGSLFDGSGGFPLAGCLHGIEPVWASEIEPFPIRVTKLRFPNMKHLGSVTDVNGAVVEPVDIITFGSPCQDLSVAGKQLGIHDGERSNLFFEAIRIIKEMRDATANEYPRFAVWENVPGAFSSNGGNDFHAVIEAFCGVCQPGVSVPRPEGGTWQPAGCVLGDGYSVAWRIYDAQYWGVPQRRKRIYLVADFRSERAGKILFERECVPGHPEPGETAREGTAADAEGSAGGGCIAFAWANSASAGLSLDGTSPTIKAAAGGEPATCFSIDHVVTNGGNCTAQGPCYYEDIAPTEKAAGPHSVAYESGGFYGNAGSSRPIDFTGGGYSSGEVQRDNTRCVRNGINCFNPEDPQSERVYGVDGVHPSLGANSGGGQNRSGVCYAIQGNTVDRGSKENGSGYSIDTSPTLNTQDKHAVCYPKKARALCARHDSSPCADRGQNVVCVQNTGQGWWNEGEVAETLRTPCGGDSTKANLVVCGVDIPTLTTFAPEGNHCGAYREDDTSATLQTKYHFGGGGDGAIAVYDCRGNGEKNPGRKENQSHVFENHSQDTRYSGPVDISQTVSATFGMGGNNTPFVVEEDDE